MTDRGLRVAESTKKWVRDLISTFAQSIELSALVKTVSDWVSSVDADQDLLTPAPLTFDIVVSVFLRISGFPTSALSIGRSDR